MFGLNNESARIEGIAEPFIHRARPKKLKSTVPGSGVRLCVGIHLGNTKYEDCHDIYETACGNGRSQGLKSCTDGN